MNAPTVFEYILSSFVPPKTQATETDLERLNDAHQSWARLDFEREPQATIRASNVLLDACFAAGMDHDFPNHEAWAAVRVTRWLTEA